MNKASSAMVTVVLLVVFLAGIGSLRAAETFPTKPITVVIPLEAGSDADLVTRPWMEKAGPILGKPMIAVNKPGAGLTLGYREIYNSKPDGHTIGVANVTIFTAKMQGFFPYDYHDFTHLGYFISQYPLLFASTKSKHPFKTLKEAVAFAKANPGEVSLATTAVGGIYWSAGLMLGMETGANLNLVPQEGSAAFVVSQLAGGHMDLGIAGAAAPRAQMDAGNIIPLAVFGPERLIGRLGNVPTFKELGYPIVIRTFTTVIGPPKIPKPVAETLTKAIKQAVTDPGYRKYIQDRSDAPVYMSPEEFVKFCDEQKGIYHKIFEKAGLLKIK